MFGNQGRDLAEGARAHEACRWQRNSNCGFERIFNFNPHERIQSEIRQRLVVAQTVWLDAQDGADDIAHGCGDDGLAIVWRCRFDFEPPVARDGGAFLAFEPADGRVPTGFRTRPDIEVDDMDVARARIEELGGTLVEVIHARPGESHFRMADPEGNEFTVVLPLPPDVARTAYGPKGAPG